MNYISKGIIDVAYCGAFKRRNVEEANQLIEGLSKSNYKAPSEASRSNRRLRGGGVIELNKMSAIGEKLDALMNIMNTQYKRGSSSNDVEILEGARQNGAADLGIAHECHYKVEEA